MLGNRPTIHVGEAHELFQRVIQQIHLGGLSKVFMNCLKTIFIHGISMCEGIGEDSRHGIGHVDIRVGIMNSLECVCFSIAGTLRRGVTHIRDYHYWALLTPSWDPPFRYRECLGRRHSLEAAFEKKADMWL